MIGWRILLAVAGALFALGIVWAFGTASFRQSFAMIVGDPWGIVTLADLYLGFLIVATIIWLTEENRIAAILWSAAICCLGNVITAIWIVWRLPRLVVRLRRQPETGTGA